MKFKIGDKVIFYKKLSIKNYPASFDQYYNERTKDSFNKRGIIIDILDPEFLTSKLYNIEFTNNHIWCLHEEQLKLAKHKLKKFLEEFKNGKA